MRTYLKYLIIVILFTGCIKNQKHSNYKVRADYFEDGELKSYSWENQEGKKSGLDIIFNDKHHLERVGHFSYDKPQGYLSYYYKNQQIGLRQYVEVENKPYMNQYWGFDESGNIDRSMSNFFSIKSSSDTISVNAEWEIDVKLDCPYFQEGMLVVFGDFDEYFNLKDSLSLEVIEGNNFEAKHKFTFSSQGTKIIRGYIDNFEYEKIEGDTIAKSRINYFKKKVIVVE